MSLTPGQKRQHAFQTKEDHVGADGAMVTAVIAVAVVGESDPYLIGDGFIAEAPRLQIPRPKPFCKKLLNLSESALCFLLCAHPGHLQLGSLDSVLS